MKQAKKWIALLLALALLCSLCLTSAFAEEAAEETAPAEAVEEAAETPAEENVEEAEAAVPEAYLEEPAASEEENTGNAYPESDHEYANNEDKSWTYSLESAEAGLLVSFSEQTAVERNYDFIYVLDGEGNEVGKYTGTTLAGATVYVPGASVTIRLTSDKSGTAYGFAVTDISAAEAGNLETNGYLDHVAPIYIGGQAAVVVHAEGKTLVEGTDYTVAYNNQEAGNQEVTVTGIGYYHETLTTTVEVIDSENRNEGAKVMAKNSSIRQYDAVASCSLPFESLTDDQFNAIESIVLTPVDLDEEGNAVPTPDHPYGAVTLAKEDITKNGNNIRFNRTSENPVVYVVAGHEPVVITGRWSTIEYPQSQVYQVTVNYSDYYASGDAGTTTYYTGTAPSFSIIEEAADGTQTVIKSWTADEIEAMATFANGSSQCGMTGFRTFSGMGVSLKDLLADAGVSVSASDYFLLDTSDHYGNSFSYTDLFDTTRYFLQGIYEEGFYDKYAELVASDDEAGSIIELRKMLAEQALADGSTVDPRVNVSYVESVLGGENLKDAELPTAANTAYDSLVNYENRFRFFYGIKLIQNDVTVTFDSNGGSEVEAQLVKSNVMTSTENTTMRSSYWANSLVIKRGQGTEPPAGPQGADTITVPAEPTKEGCTFGGWYTNAACSEGCEFDFEANNGTVDADTTLYARWIGPKVVDYSIANAEHDDADAELNQTIIVTLTFDRAIKLLSDDLSGDLDIRIAGGSVYDTARDVSFAVDSQDSTKLVITMVSTDWVAIYNGLLTVKEGANGIINIVDAADETVAADMDSVSDQIPIGIKLENAVTAGTAEAPASTTVTVAHKANMRGMYHFQLLSNGEPVVARMTSHAHAFYTTITPESIASAMANGINSKCEGYTAVYNEETNTFTVTADEALAGEVLVVRMVEYGATDSVSEELLEAVVEGEDTLAEVTNGETKYDEASVEALKEALAAAETLLNKADATDEEKAAAVDAIAEAMENVSVLLTITPFEKKSGKDVVIVCGRVMEEFAGIKMDGKEISKDSYTVASGSTIITLKAAYCDTLAAGDHQVTLVYNKAVQPMAEDESEAAQDEYNVTLTVTEKATAPANNNGSQTKPVGTGDSSANLIVICLAVLAVSGTALVVLKKKRTE